MTNLTPPRKSPSALNMVLPALSIALLGYTGSVLAGALASDQPVSSTAVTNAHFSATALKSMDQNACCRIELVSASRSTTQPTRESLVVTITNRSPATLQISPGLQLGVQDAVGTSYPYTAAYLPVGATTGGPLSAGTSRTEKLDFEVPTNVSLKSLRFQLDASSVALTVKVP